MPDTRRIVALAATVGLVAALFLAPGIEARNARAPMNLSFFSGGHGASAHWTFADVPLGQKKAIQLTNPKPTSTTWAGALVHGAAGLKMSDVTALSFMIDTDHYMGAGAPRFSVLTDAQFAGKPVTLFPSARDCPLDPGHGWQTADFINNCLIYSSTGGPQTWTQWTSSLSDPTITELFLIQDEGPAVAYVANVVVNQPIH